MNTMDNVIDASLEGLGPDEIAGAYRSLCGMMLIQTALSFRSRRPCRRKEDVRERRAAREWVDGAPGVLTFTECCDAMGMDEETTRKAMTGLAEGDGLPPISKSVFGVRHNVLVADAPGRSR
jgi:hypothetical protein